MEKKKEKKIKNARDWMSPARGKEAEQSLGKGEEEGNGNILYCYVSYATHKVIK